MKRRRLATALLMSALLAGCGSATAMVHAVTPPASPGDGGILPAHVTLSVAGDRLLRNGVAFVPRGVTLAGFLAPYPSLPGVYADARDAFGPEELARAKGFGADTLRFLFGQSALVPPIGSSGVAFRRSLLDAVANARAQGFAVVVALDASAPTGEAVPQAMPSDATRKAWAVLAPLFAQDRGIAFEVFNAPGAAPTPSAWAAWATGGSVPGQTAVTGMQDIVSTIRAAGAANVVIADGLDHGHTLNGAPVLNDPEASIVYGVEPYQRQGDGDGAWDTDFGILAASRPVLASEWDAPSVPPPNTVIPQFCTPDTPHVAAALLRYLSTRRIGVIGYAFDVAGTLVRDLSFAVTSYDRFTCGVGGGGPGEILGLSFTSSA